MIYGNADFMNIPWETIIKIYRNHIGDKCRDTIKQYAQDFISYLRKEVSSPKDEQKRRVYAIWNSYFLHLDEDLRFALRDMVSKLKRSLQKEEARDIVKAKIKMTRDQLETLHDLKAFSKTDPNNLVNKYSDEFDKAVKNQFSGRPITPQGQKYLREIAGLLITKSGSSPLMSGLVIAGFGDKEIFPSLIHYTTDGVVDNKLIIDEVNYHDISRDRTSVIQAFAQSDMVFRFMEGVDQDYLQVLETGMEALLYKFGDALIEKYSTGNRNVINARKTRTRKAAALMVEEMMRIQDNIRREIFVNDVVRTVDILPKEELAKLAESLVSLTSLKRRVSSDLESVGGPIDVAIISKGDGFIWTKRKHYFEPELNPQFVRRYLSNETKAGGENDG